MGQIFPSLNELHKEFIKNQKLFFVATAPNDGRINLSPKGHDTFAVITDHQVGYLDFTGSGNETAAHIYENGRLTIMFCSFSEKAMILRLSGKGFVIRQQDDLWQQYHPYFEGALIQRQIILLDIDRVQVSCGFGVPLFEYQGDRDTLIEWGMKLGEEGKVNYWKKNNLTSIDGLPTNLLDDKE